MSPVSKLLITSNFAFYGPGVIRGSKVLLIGTRKAPESKYFCLIDCEHYSQWNARKVWNHGVGDSFAESNAIVNEMNR